MGVNSLPKTVTRQRRDCDLNPGPYAPESSTLTTRLPSHPGPYVTETAGKGLLKHCKLSVTTLFPRNNSFSKTVSSLRKY